MGRVTSGEGGVILLSRAQEVLDKEFPELAKKIELHIPDESSRRVGQSVAAEFHAFCRGAMTEADIRAILADPEHAPIPTEPDRKWTLISWLTAMPDESSDAAGILLGRLEPEFAVVLARGMLTARPAFFANQHFQAFMADHTDVFGG